MRRMTKRRITVCRWLAPVVLLFGGLQAAYAQDAAPPPPPAAPAAAPAGCPIDIAAERTAEDTDTLERTAA